MSQNQDYCQILLKCANYAYLSLILKHQGNYFLLSPKDILFNKSILNSLSRYHIFQEGDFCNTSDHLPILATFIFNCSRHSLQTSKLKLPAWHKATSDDVISYKSIMSTDLHNLLKLKINSTADMNDFYQNLCRIITYASKRCIPHTGYNPHTRPGWNKEVKELHTTERKLRRIWISQGRPRGMQFESYRNYKRAKMHFRKALQIQKKTICVMYTKI